jgi:uncharacterized protein (TIGR02246 family)
MNRAQMEAHARSWIDAWNARDLDAVLEPFAEDAEFVSPVALQLTGESTIHGRANIEAYWRKALAAIQTLVFELDAVVCDEDRSEMVVLYVAQRNAVKTRACELMRFHAGRQIYGEALYGAAV